LGIGVALFSCTDQFPVCRFRLGKGRMKMSSMPSDIYIDLDPGNSEDQSVPAGNEMNDSGMRAGIYLEVWGSYIICGLCIPIKTYMLVIMEPLNGMTVSFSNHTTLSFACSIRIIPFRRTGSFSIAASRRLAMIFLLGWFPVVSSVKPTHYTPSTTWVKLFFWHLIACL